MVFVFMRNVKFKVIPFPLFIIGTPTKILGGGGTRSYTLDITRVGHMVKLSGSHLRRDNSSLIRAF